MTNNVDYLIVGSGPVGLFTANLLLITEKKIVLIDKRENISNRSKAIVIYSTTLEILDTLGLANEVIKKGLIPNSFNLYIKGKLMGKTELNDKSSRFPFILLIEQHILEEILLKKFEQTHLVYWGHKLISIKEQPDKVICEISNKNKNLSIESKIVIASDGSKSTIASQLNIYDKSLNRTTNIIAADLDINWGISFGEVIHFFTNYGSLSAYPLNDITQKKYRIYATPSQSNQYLDYTENEIEKVIKELTSIPNFAIGTIHHFSKFKIRMHLLEKFVTKRVIFVGDSAYYPGPTSGQGLNSGIQDAFNLCWRFNINLNMPISYLLLSYNSERQQIAEKILPTNYINKKSIFNVYNIINSILFIWSIPVLKHLKYFIYYLSFLLIKNNNYIRVKFIETLTRNNYQFKIDNKIMKRIDNFSILSVNNNVIVNIHQTISYKCYSRILLIKKNTDIGLSIIKELIQNAKNENINFIIILLNNRNIQIENKNNVYYDLDSKIKIKATCIWLVRPDLIVENIQYL